MCHQVTFSTVDHIVAEAVSDSLYPLNVLVELIQLTRNPTLANPRLNRIMDAESTNSINQIVASDL
jgi:hypothetical protein